MKGKREEGRGKREKKSKSIKVAVKDSTGSRAAVAVQTLGGMACV